MNKIVNEGQLNFLLFLTKLKWVIPSLLTDNAESERGLALPIGVTRRAHVEASVLGGRVANQHGRTAVFEDSLLLDLDPALGREGGRKSQSLQSDLKIVYELDIHFNEHF